MANYQNFAYKTPLDTPTAGGSGYYTTASSGSTAISNYLADVDGNETAEIGETVNFGLLGSYGDQGVFSSTPTLFGYTNYGVVIEDNSGDIFLLTNINYAENQNVSINTGGNYNYDSTFCFLENTLISLNEEKEIPVQDLKIGDQILTKNGSLKEIKWIGLQKIKNNIFTDSNKSPVCLTAGSLGNGLPHSDLLISGDHGLFIDGLIINASALVNDKNIFFVPLAEMPREFTYYHIETEAHDEIYANGTLAETFIDYAARTGFDNYQEYIDLYGSEKKILEISKPRISSQRELPPYLEKKFSIKPFEEQINSEFLKLQKKLFHEKNIPSWDEIIKDSEMCVNKITS